MDRSILSLFSVVSIVILSSYAFLSTKDDPSKLIIVSIVTLIAVLLNFYQDELIDMCADYQTCSDCNDKVQSSKDETYNSYNNRDYVYNHQPSNNPPRREEHPNNDRKVKFQGNRETNFNDYFQDQNTNYDDFEIDTYKDDRVPDAKSLLPPEKYSKVWIDLNGDGDVDQNEIFTRNAPTNSNQPGSKVWIDLDGDGEVDENEIFYRNFPQNPNQHLERNQPILTPPRKENSINNERNKSIAIARQEYNQLGN